ncbi:MAG: hypothetical protein DMF52_15170 [Acidobacteria bacterium]|nr:MAG: hypothetical protein DMF52_15170 [Acidobacteriota bacterium]
MGGRVAVLSTSADKEPEAQRLGAERFINVRKSKPAEALKEWGGGVDLVFAIAPDAETMAATFPGLAIDGTMMVLSASFAPLTVSPFDLIMGRPRLMGTPAGSRKDHLSKLEWNESVCDKCCRVRCSCCEASRRSFLRSNADPAHRQALARSRRSGTCHREKFADCNPERAN